MVLFSKRLAVILIDDNSTSRSSVLALIRAQPGFEVLATTALVAEALDKVRQLTPDLVLLHLPPEGDDAVTLAGAIHGEFPASRIVVMGCQVPQQWIAQFVRAGVAGFVLAAASLETLLTTMHAVAGGSRVLPEALTTGLFEQLRRQDPRGRPRRVLETSKLTQRERDVTELIVQGLSNKAIADRLGIALHTVKSHVHKVLSKLSVNSRLEIAAFSRGTPPPESPPEPRRAS